MLEGEDCRFAVAIVLYVSWMKYLDLEAPSVWCPLDYTATQPHSHDSLVCSRFRGFN